MSHLKSDFNIPDELDEAYIEAIGKELSHRFGDLTSGDILDLLLSLPQNDLNT